MTIDWDHFESVFWNALARRAPDASYRKDYLRLSNDALGRSLDRLMAENDRQLHLARMWSVPGNKTPQ